MFLIIFQELYYYKNSKNNMADPNNMLLASALLCIFACRTVTASGLYDPRIGADSITPLEGRFVTTSVPSPRDLSVSYDLAGM